VKQVKREKKQYVYKEKKESITIFYLIEENKMKEVYHYDYKHSTATVQP
jgi:hypothetical protein